MDVPAAPFSRTLGALRGDSHRVALAWLGVIAVLVVAWGVWLARARVGLYVASASARTEVERAVHPIAAEAAGTVVEVLVALGDDVRAGEALVRLDSGAEELALAEEDAREASLVREIAALAAELEARERARALDVEAGVAAASEAEARLVERELDARLARDELDRLTRLHALGGESEQELERRRTEAEREAAEAETQRRTALREASERRARAGLSEADLAGLAREREGLQGALEACRAERARLAGAIARRTLRAPADGKIAELASLARGAWVAAGDAVATVVAEGAVTVRATFAAGGAVGRLAPGQHGRMRLDAFPWQQHGTLAVRVERVGTEGKNGLVQVELALEDGARAVGHGLPGSVEVEVERVAPWEVVVRAAGGRVARASAPGSSGAPAEAR